MNVVLCIDKDWLFTDEAYSIYASCMYQPTMEAYQIQMERYLSDPSVKVFICEVNNEKVGILVLDRSESVAVIAGIAVSENCRHHGIGRNMIDKVMESERLETIVAQTDDDSIGFYRKCGFAEKKNVIEYPDGFAVRYQCIFNKSIN